MEKSMNNEVEPVQSLKNSVMFTAACGFALYWACFFTMLMRNSFMDGEIEELWYHLFLRIVFLTGAAIACIIIKRKADWFLSERGIRLQKSGVALFSVVAASSSFTAYKVAFALPLAFDFIAWGLAGVGISCLFMLWIEALSSLQTRECSLTLICSIALGAAIYLIMNTLAFPFNISMLCLLPLASLGISSLLEKDPAFMPAAFIPLNDSRKRARLSPFFKGISVLCGVVFGLGIGSTTQIGGSGFLYTGIAFMLAIGAGCAFLALRNCADYSQRYNALRLLFPVLIIALIPMSFLQGLTSIVCNLLLLGCYIFFETVSIEFTLFLARYKRTSRIYLVGSSQTCLYIGLALGHVIGLVATYSGVMDYSMLSMTTLGLVVILAIVITFAPLSPLADDSADSAKTRFFEEDAAKSDSVNDVNNAGGNGVANEDNYSNRCGKGNGYDEGGGFNNAASDDTKSNKLNGGEPIAIGSVEVIESVEVSAGVPAGAPAGMSAGVPAGIAEAANLNGYRGGYAYAGVALENDVENEKGGSIVTSQSSQKDGRWKTSCKKVAQESGLSARETEVFMLLAKGRGIEHIQNKLCISGHTVKTHVYNIYRKMDISSREELLDAIENCRL